MTETLSASLPEDLDRAVVELLRTATDREIRLATAESCTGGLIASLLTDVQGASHVFERGFVVYSARAKREMLGVDGDLIARAGVVSREVAIAMAEGGLDNSAADVCLSVTGFAGPAGEGDEPGLVHFACARRGRPTVHRVEHFGDQGRGPVRIACARVAVGMMREMIG